MFNGQAQFSELQKNQLDFASAVSQAALQSAERFVNLQLASGRAWLRDSAATAQSLVDARDPQEFASRLQASVQPTLDRVTSYSREVYSLANGVGGELSKIVDSQVGEAGRNLSKFYDEAAKSAPVGSESAVAWLKNAATASSAAYDNMVKAARQAVEMVESNTNAMVSATTEAARPKARKAA